MNLNINDWTNNQIQRLRELIFGNTDPLGQSDIPKDIYLVEKSIDERESDSFNRNQGYRHEIENFLDHLDGSRELELFQDRVRRENNEEN